MISRLWMTSAVRLVSNKTWASVGLEGGSEVDIGTMRRGVSGTKMGGTYHNGKPGQGAKGERGGEEVCV